MNVQPLITQLSRGLQLDSSTILQIASQTKLLFLEQQNIIKIGENCLIISDILGNFQSALRVLKLADLNPTFSIVILGNYIGINSKSLQSLLLIYLLKIKHKIRVVLLRGCLQSVNVSLHFGFYYECRNKTNSPAVWRALTESFSVMPVAALHNDIFMVHGGIPQKIEQVDSLRILRRSQPSPQTTQILGELLWNEPSQDQNWHANKKGYGKLFPSWALYNFLRLNGLNKLIRGFERQEKKSICMQWEDSMITVNSNYYQQGQDHMKGVVLVRDGLVESGLLSCNS